MRSIKVKNKKVMDSMIRDFRTSGLNIITYGKKLVELENDDELIVIEIVK